MAAVQSLSSRDNPLLLKLRRLQGRPGAYRSEGQVWLEGDHLCRAWTERGWPVLDAVIDQSAWDARPDLRELALHAPRVALLAPGLMRQISALDSPAQIGMLVALPAQGAAELVPGLPTVVLDRLQDPGNAGSILRTAAALGFGQVLALKETVALWSPKVLRAGMGAHFSLSLVEGLDLAALEPLSAHLVVADSRDGQPLAQAPLPASAAWVFGHEGAGVGSALVSMARWRVRIPQPGGQESLNVAAAAAICLYESLRRRQ